MRESSRRSPHNFGEFCNRQVVVARRERSVAEAARRVRDVGTLLVLDDQDGWRLPVGVLTDRDLVVRVPPRREASARGVAS